MWVTAFTTTALAHPEFEGENFTLALLLLGRTSVWPLPLEVMQSFGVKGYFVSKRFLMNFKNHLPFQLLYRGFADP